MQIPHYSLILNVNAQKSTQTIVAKQYDDKSRYIDIILTADSKPIVLNNERVTLTAFDKKAKETIALTDCTIIDNVIVAELTANILSVATTLECEITVYGTSGEILTSAQFNVIVDGKLSTDVVEQEKDFSALQTALADVASTSNRIDEVSSRVQAIALGGTGATKAYDAAQNLKALYLGAVTTIPSDADLNDYTTDGTYDVGQSVSTSIVNSPVTGSTYKLFVMHAVASTLTEQIIIVPGKAALYLRCCSSGTWSAWTKIASYNPQIDEVGTWNPAVDSGTITAKNADYVYDGNTVTITITFTAGSDISGTSLTITGLPLTAKRAVAAAAYVNGSNASAASINGTGILVKSDSQLTGKSITVTGTYLV